MFGFLRTFFFGPRPPPPEYRTTDGHHLAPYPNMSDRELREFEVDMDVPNATFHDLAWYPCMDPSCDGPLCADARARMGQLAVTNPGAMSLAHGESDV